MSKPPKPQDLYADMPPHLRGWIAEKRAKVGDFSLTVSPHSQMDTKATGLFPVEEIEVHYGLKSVDRIYFERIPCKNFALCIRGNGGIHYGG